MLIIIYYYEWENRLKQKNISQKITIIFTDRMRINTKLIRTYMEVQKHAEIQINHRHLRDLTYRKIKKIIVIEDNQLKMHIYNVTY
jgi:hypothetical protein